jgi:REP element-mobilizing transposase RayT
VAPGSLGAIIRSFKSAVSRRANLELGISNIWQRNYHDHIIRNDREWRKIRDYISTNPANWEADEENPGSMKPVK